MGVWFDYVESGEEYVVLQFYADHGYLMLGPRIKYTFTRKNGILVPLCYTFVEGGFNQLNPASHTS